MGLDKNLFFEYAYHIVQKYRPLAIVSQEKALLYFSCYYYCYIRFQDTLGKPLPEKQNHSGTTNLDLLEQERVSGSGIC